MKICPRTIDKPLLIGGLEIEDIAILVLGYGLPALIFNPIIPLLAFGVSWPVLVFIKRGKPEGYMLHLLYSYGMNLKGLLPSGDKIKYSPFSRPENSKK
jgi:type IV conjugative transfer system protein TraL